MSLAQTEIRKSLEIRKKLASERLVSIDCLRGIAALAVLVFHAREILWVGAGKLWHTYGIHASIETWIGYATLPLRFGYQGVMLFFVISGYCIHRHYLNRESNDSNSAFNLKQYLKRRFRRIFPVLAGALCLTMVVDSYVRMHFPNESKLGDGRIVTFLVNLFAMQGILGANYGTNVQLWSLSIEVHLYLLYPFLLRMRHRLGIRMVLGTSLAVSVLFIMVNFWKPSWKLDFLPYLFVWLLGCYVAELEAGLVKLPKWPFGTVGGICFLLGIVFCKPELRLIGNIFLSVAFAILIGWSTIAGAQFWNVKSRRWLAYFGLFSYSIYAIHGPLLVFFRAAFMSDVQSPHLIWILLGIAFSLASAWLFFQLIERWTIKGLSVKQGN